MTKKPKKQSPDVIGLALKTYWADRHSDQGLSQRQPIPSTIHVHAQEVDEDILPVEYLFRGFEAMPLLERKALALCKGRVLDIGAAAGCHSLVLKARGLEVDAIDLSPGAVEVMQAQGIHAWVANCFELSTEKTYTTILLLMNGLGIAGTIWRLPSFLAQLRALVDKDGLVLVDSSDFKEDAEAFATIHYQMSYQGLKTPVFPWLFLPFEQLKVYSEARGFSAECVYTSDSGAYLAALKPVL